MEEERRLAIREVGVGPTFTQRGPARESDYTSVGGDAIEGEFYELPPDVEEKFYDLPPDLQDAVVQEATERSYSGGEFRSDLMKLIRAAYRDWVNYKNAQARGPKPTAKQPSLLQKLVGTNPKGEQIRDVYYGRAAKGLYVPKAPSLKGLGQPAGGLHSQLTGKGLRPLYNTPKRLRGKR